MNDDNNNNTSDDDGGDQDFFDALGGEDEEDDDDDEYIHDEVGGDDMSTSQREQFDDDDEEEEEEFMDAIGDSDGEDNNDDEEASQLSTSSSSGSGSSSSEGPTERDRRSYLPGASHPLLPDGGAIHHHHQQQQQNRMVNSNNEEVVVDEDNNSMQEQQLPILELPGLVLFPGCTIPIRLSNRSWIQHLGSQIDESRRVGSHDFGRTVQLGILTLEERNTVAEASIERNNDGRRRSSLWRRGVTRNSRQQRRLSRIIQQELLGEDGMSESDDDNDDDNDDDANNPPTRRATNQHPFVGRVGTIATVTYTHGDAVLDDDNNNDPRIRHSTRTNQSSSTTTTTTTSSTISRASGVWQRHAEEQGELILQAVGTSRFCVKSYIDFQSFADVQVFRVQEFQQDHNNLICPSSSCQSLPRRKLPYDSSQIDTTEGITTNMDDSLDNNSSSRRCRSSLRHQSQHSRHNNRQNAINTKYYVSHHDSLIRQLSIVTPLPQLVYQQVWPWRIVGQMVDTIQSKGGRAARQTTTRTSSSSNRSSLLQSLAELLQDPEIAGLMDHPTQFSFWMASNMPLTVEEKLQLLRIPTTVERLHKLQKHLRDYTNKESPMKICCRGCHIPLSDIDCVFTVGGADGTTSNHVNEHGFIHQVVTIRRINDNRLIYLQGRPSTENSYYPGYSWTITVCRRCGSMLGWTFNWVGLPEEDDDEYYNGAASSMSVRSSRSSRRRRRSSSSVNRPPTFFGFMSSSLITQQQDEE